MGEPTEKATMRVKIVPGAWLGAEAERLCRLARECDLTVVAEFNGVDLVAEPWMTPSTVESTWTDEMRKRQRKARQQRLDALASQLAMQPYSTVRECLEDIVPR